MSATHRVFVINTDCEQPAAGAWFWVVLDDDGKPEGEPVGPFKTASEAGQAARNALLSELLSRATTSSQP